MRLTQEQANRLRRRVTPKNLPGEEAAYRLEACLSQKTIHAMWPDRSYRAACRKRLPGGKMASPRLRDGRHITCKKCLERIEQDERWWAAKP